MKLRWPLAVILALLVLPCSSPPTVAEADCSKTATGDIPILDLGNGTYQGSEGGLYPGGGNDRPLEHDRTLDRTGRMVLLDAAGEPDVDHGIFVLVAIGASNAKQEFDDFMTAVGDDPEVNSKLVLVNLGEGGQMADRMAQPQAPYWTHAKGFLADAGVTPEQVQAVWLKPSMKFPTGEWPGSATVFLDHLRAIVRNVKTHFPNARAIYLSSRAYAGYGPESACPEPYAYHYGFSTKWLVEEQLAASPDLNCDPEKGPVLAPWLAWGPYLWADGLNVRSDGLFWECSDFHPDGNHLSEDGRVKVVELLLSFFRDDPVTRPWFLDCDLSDPATFAPPPEVLAEALTGHPDGTLDVAWASLDPVAGPGTVYDVVRGRIDELREDGGYARATCAVQGLSDTPWVDATPELLPGGGLYYLVRGRNSCGAGSFGSTGLVPDPRAALDAAACGDGPPGYASE
jgi:hypothetical protein